MNLGNRRNISAEIITGLFIAALVFISGCSPTPEYIIKKTIIEVSVKKDVRVLLLKTKEKVKISSESKIKVREIKSGQLISDSPKFSAEFRPDQLSASLVIESWDSPVSVNGIPYRGDIELHSVVGVINVINVISMNDYLKGVVPCETPATWPIEALKAQAVAARTYCYSRISSGGQDSLYALDATVRSQVYKGFSAEKPESSRAVDETDDVIIMDNNKPIIAYFHSTCGGATIGNNYVWSGAKLDYLKGIKCGYCGSSPHFAWEQKLTLDEITQTIGTKYKNIDKITKVSFIKKENRVTEVRISYGNGSMRMNGNDFRLMFQPQVIKSLYFTAEKNGQGLLLKGHGYGHGVGMCQWGAKGMAESGYEYKDILSHYYNSIRIIKIDKSVSPAKTAFNRP